DGHTVRKRLAEDFDIFPEMSTATTLVALIGIGKSPDIERLIDALETLRLDTAAHAEAGTTSSLPPLPTPGRLALTPRAAYFAESELVPAAEAVGRVSVSSLAAYPPGIPNVLPGEEITVETIDFLQTVGASPSGHVRRSTDAELQHFRVTKFCRLPAVPVGDEPHRRAPRRSLSVHPRRPLSRLGTTASSVPENSLHRPPEDCSSAILISVMPITKLIDMPDRSGKDISRCSKPNASPSGQSRRP